MNSDLFQTMRKQLSIALARAVESVLAAFYDDCDITLQVRRSRCVRVDIRVIDQISPDPQN